MKKDNHLLRQVYVVFAEGLGFRTKTGWHKKFSKAKIFTQRNHITATYTLKEMLSEENTTARIVPIQMMIEESDYTALLIGGFLTEQ